MRILSHLLDIIYPPKCYICLKFLQKNIIKEDRAGRGFCESCLEGFSKITSPRCPLCARPVASEIGMDHLCGACLRNRPFYDAVGAPYLYEGGLMRAIHQFKYGGKTYLASALGPLLAQFAREWLDERERGLMMPVPLHPKRLRERGFNQSLLLARHVASFLGLDLDFLTLRRMKYTQPQAGLSRDERRKNVRRAFDIPDRKAVKGLTIILVDDVATTGNTLNECARMLKRYGCKKVFCLVLARTSSTRPVPEW